MITDALQRFLGVFPEPPHDHDITPERVSYLARILGDPTPHAQRFVEQLSFVHTGGQQWHRTLQVRMPVLPGGSGGCLVQPPCEAAFRVE